MKLYELPRNTWFRINSDPEQMKFYFDHIDGMYSLCLLNGEMYHISATEEVTPIEDLEDVPF